MKEYLLSFQDETNASVVLGIMLKNNVAVVELVSCI